jgi:hypothetical protein
MQPGTQFSKLAKNTFGFGARMAIGSQFARSVLQTSIAAEYADLPVSSGGFLSAQASSLAVR